MKCSEQKPQGQTYTLKLSASDGALTGTDTLVLTVNKAPVVNAGPDQTITLPGSATLSGSATDDGIPNSAWRIKLYLEQG